MKSIKYHWLWVEYRYLGKQVEHDLKTYNNLLDKMNNVKKDLEAMKHRLYTLEQEVKIGLMKK